MALRLLAVSALAIGGCAPERRPDNLEPAATGGAYQAQYSTPVKDAHQSAVSRNAARCRAPLGGKARSTRPPAALGAEVLSRGDLLDIRIIGDDTFSHAYEVSYDGTVRVPFIGPVQAAGRSAAAVQATLSDKLVAGGYYQQPPEISVLVRDYGSVRVGVSGAVFEPHAIELGLQGDTIDAGRQEAFGGSTEARSLSAALRAAGGVRPDADLSAVRVRRGGASFAVDMRGALDGTGFSDVMLISGDEISVPSRGCFQDDLMVPSPISPPGISLFLSNLTQPASNNASSAISTEARQVPYGTRFLQAVINANCVGGVLATSASRSAALLSRNPETKVSVVIERRIEDMMTRPDRDDYDPWLLPGDALACYDSAVTNLGDVAHLVGTVLHGG